MRRIEPRRGNVPRKIASLASMGGLVGETEWPEIWECNTSEEVLDRKEKYELDATVFIPRTALQSKQEDRAYIVAWGYQINVSEHLGMITSDKPIIYFAYASPAEVRKWRRDIGEYTDAQEKERKLDKLIEEERAAMKEEVKNEDRESPSRDLDP